MTENTKTKPLSAISWMANNPVAANLMMLVCIIGGIIMVMTQVKQEIFPEFEVDTVIITVAYPGASPEEVEQGIILSAEEAVRGIEGVKEVRSTATEGVAIITVELMTDANKNKVSTDIKNAIDRITTFPPDAEEPLVQIPTTRRQVISLVIYGDVSENTLKELAESARDDLLQNDRITQVEVGGVRPREITIEIPSRVLRSYDVTIDDIAAVIKRSAVEVPAGGIETKGGEILLKTDERRDLGSDFENIIVISTADGGKIRLGDIAKITDGFEDTDNATYFDGKRAVSVEVFRIGDQTPIEVANIVKEYEKSLEKILPEGVKSAIWLDRSQFYYERIDLLKRNAMLGLVLVLVILGLFLEIRLAFWVTMGIPTAFLGSFLFLPIYDVSINMISLFAFIVTLGLVVDDAIVVGENVYVWRQETDGSKKGFLSGSIFGTSEVATPVVFSVLTTLAAFAPLLFVPGTMGKIFKIIPLIIIAVLTLSLVESLFILPAHLGHLGKPRETGLFGLLYRMQQWVGRLVEKTADKFYGPIVRFSVNYRWVTFSIGIFMLLVSVGLVKGGRVSVVFFPKIESDWVVAKAALPFGVNISETLYVKERLEKAAEEVIAANSTSTGKSISKGILTPISGTESVNVLVSLVPSSERNIGATAFANQWREKVGRIPGLESLEFDSTAGGPSGGKPIDIMLIHKDMEVLKKAAAELAEMLKSYQGVIDIDDGFAGGKPQLNYKITPEARSLGLTASEIGRQMRNNFLGAEVLKQQRGRDDITVRVRLPENERNSEHSVEELLIRTPGGGEIPLSRAAQVTRGTSYTSIKRTDGRRTVHVVSDLDYVVADSRKILPALENNELVKLMQEYPGLTYAIEGAEKEGQESLQSLFTGFIFALLVIYALIAIPFKSYVQPIVVLSAIPFGFIGSLIGHMMMGYSMSLVSMMGLLALSGVVVNDSLVMVHAANSFCGEGMSIKDAVVQAGVRRFRPIWLTSLTTFFGLTPMILEKSLQARFLIPMAISLGFGVLFATFITLVLVPALYVIVSDVSSLFKELFTDIGRIFGFFGRIFRLR